MTDANKLFNNILYLMIDTDNKKEMWYIGQRESYQNKDMN